MTTTLAEIHLDDALIGVALLAAVLSLCVVIRKRRSRLNPAQHASVERDVQQLLTELAQMATNITDQLDARTTALKTLLREADEKIAALKEATTFHDAPQAAAERSAAADPPSEPINPVITSSSAPDERYTDVYALADQGQSPQQIARHLGRPSGEIELILALRTRS